jgi:hypothetical protein
VRRNRVEKLGLWVGVAFWLAWVATGASGHAQFHQSQPTQNGPLGPTIPGQIPSSPLPQNFLNAGSNIPNSNISNANIPGSNPAVAGGLSNLPATGSTDRTGNTDRTGSLENMRTDSTLAGVRPLTNLSNPVSSGGTAGGYYPTTVPTSGSNESQQGTGLPALPFRPDAGQDPWRSSNPGTANPPFSSGVTGTPSLLNPSNVQNPAQPGSITSLPSNFGGGTMGQPSNPWALPGQGGLQGQGFGSTPVMVPQPGGEMTATNNRMLPNDQVQRPRSNQSVAERQAAIANQWDPYINMTTPASQGARRGRSSILGQDGLSEYQADPSDRQTLSEKPVVTTTLAGRDLTLTEDSASKEGTTATKSEASMDALSWWLMMCSVMANLILFYFLYDSRAKYLDLADELQSRFFREG